MISIKSLRRNTAIVLLSVILAGCASGGEIVAPSKENPPSVNQVAVVSGE